jgi:uncharacterized protein with PQ loop repeat
MQLGHITLNISLMIYLILFLPQTVHNQIYHKTKHISLWTHSLMILAISLDLIYAIGSFINWQYILVDSVLLIFLVIQQFQILNDDRCYKIYLHSIVVIAYMCVVMYIIACVNIYNDKIEILGYISGIIYTVYWLPQLYKNFMTKSANGFGIIYLILTMVVLMCDLVSAVSLNWPLPSLLTSVFLIIITALLIFQYYYYKSIE